LQRRPRRPFRSHGESRSGAASLNGSSCAVASPAWRRCPLPCPARLWPSKWLSRGRCDVAHTCHAKAASLAAGPPPTPCPLLLLQTAASCVVDPNTGRQLGPEFALPLVRVGGHNRVADPPAAYDLRRAVRVEVHPRFRWGDDVDDAPDSDVALMLLDRPSTKAPIRLARHTRELAAGGRKGHGSGLGWVQVSCLHTGFSVCSNVKQGCGCPAMPSAPTHPPTQTALLSAPRSQAAPAAEAWH
jgi:hypothetical protein